VSRIVSLSWAKYIKEVTKSKVTGRYFAFGWCGKRFEWRESPFELAVVRDGEEAELKGSKSNGSIDRGPAF